MSDPTAYAVAIDMPSEIEIRNARRRMRDGRRFLFGCAFLALIPAVLWLADRSLLRPIAMSLYPSGLDVVLSDLGGTLTGLLTWTCAALVLSIGLALMSHTKTAGILVLVVCLALAGLAGWVFLYSRFIAVQSAGNDVLLIYLFPRPPLRIPASDLSDVSIEGDSETTSPGHTVWRYRVRAKTPDGEYISIWSGDARVVERAKKAMTREDSSATGRFPLSSPARE